MHHVLTFGAVVGLDDYIIQSVLIETVYFARSWYLLILALRGYLKNLCVPLRDNGIKDKNV